MADQNPTNLGSPDKRIVDDFHLHSDVDERRDSQHHTLGFGANQASPGSHKHDGNDSYQLLEGTEITGSKSGGGALASVIAALVSLGAKDSTTA